MARYLLNTLATKDLSDIADYFKSTNMEAGERFFREFDRKCKQIVAFPNSGKSYAQIKLDLRGLSFQGYVIFYRVLEDGVEILRVLSDRRNFPDFFKDSN